MSSPPPQRRPATPAEARAMANALRLRIVRETLDAPLTNSEIAERVGRDKATVLHHVRVLVETGFLVPGEPRRGARGSREKPYRATGKSWYLDVSDPALASGIDDAMVGAFVEELAENRRRDLPPPALTRLAVRLTPDEREELENVVYGYLNDLAGRRREPAGPPGAGPSGDEAGHDEGERFAIFVALYRRPD